MIKLAPEQREAPAHWFKCTNIFYLNLFFYFKYLFNAYIIVWIDCLFK